ncbi:DMT family transporter [Terribacillus saccharophilus]|uniref:DMT family transporter n=1 Tax=Terribacillus saccharophilus TaxID=361277 RepID=UPI000C99BEDF|nr:DMT family transporter [Terribacillus goriensis]
MFASLLGIIIGAGLSVQTPINSELRKIVKSPVLSSMVSFIVGLIFLAIITIAIGSTIGIPIELFRSQPAWIWFGGLCGAVFLTANILIFPKLGSVETTVMPIIGMITMSMLIDTFGWFNSAQQPFGINRILGIFFLLLGVFLAVALKEIRNSRRTSSTKKEKKGNPWTWRIVGVVIGTAMPMQTAINAQLGNMLNSYTKASLVYFLVASITLIIIVGLKDRTYSHMKKAFKPSAPRWIWFGGILGGINVFTNIYLVNKLGTGQTVILQLSGQITGSLLVQHFGLLRSKKNRIVSIQIIGLVIMFIGLILIIYKKCV